MKKLYIFGEIWDNEVDDKYVNRFLSSLKSNEEFEVYINSPGGSVFQGIAIYNLLKPYNPIVKIIGQASSIASVIACAGQVKIAETAFMLIHNPWNLAVGDSNYHKKIAQHLDTLKEGIINIYKEKTGKTEDELSKLMDEETLLGAKECVSWAFANEMFSPSKDEEKSLYQFAALNLKNENKLFNNHTGDNPMATNVEVDNVNLQNEIKNLSKEKGNLETKLTEALAVNQSNLKKIEEANKKYTVLETKQNANEKELKEAKVLIAKFEAKSVEMEVDNFIARNSNKILPAENNKENNFLLKQKLLNLKKNEDLMKIGDKSMYQIECDGIEARLAVLDNLGRDIQPPKDEMSQDGNVIITKESFLETGKDVDKMDASITKLANEKNISYEEAYNVFLEQSNL